MRRFVCGLMLLSGIIATGCGYKPTALYTKKSLGDRIYAKVETSLEDPQNSLLIQDAVNEAVINKFHSKLVAKKNADTVIDLKLRSVIFRPITFDQNGYVTAYKTLVKLQSEIQRKGQSKETVITEGDYDFNIQTLSVISDTKRFNAIKEASQKAIDALISRVSIGGMQL